MDYGQRTNEYFDIYLLHIIPDVSVLRLKKHKKKTTHSFDVVLVRKVGILLVVEIHRYILQ